MTDAPGDHDRLLAAVGADGRARPLAEHRRHATAPPVRRTADRTLIDEVRRAGLTGRGGASFPTGAKLGAVAGTGVRHERPIVVANGSEGEPTSRKDVQLLARAPHLVLDGAGWAAAAVGAEAIIVAVQHGAHDARAAVRHAIDERRQTEPDAIPISMVTVVDRYVAGEERTLVRAIDGGPPLPPGGPRLRPDQRGVGGRPTLVDNVETLAHLALIAEHGAAWFRRVGTATDPGTTLITVTGAVRAPGVYEPPLGLSVGAILDAAGGPVGPLQAVQVGGYAGGWLTAGELGTPLERGALARLGASIGCGSLVALPAGACGLAEAGRVLDWLAGQSAGQCGPCVHGLRAIADAMAALTAGTTGPETVALLHRWATQVEGRGACGLPDGAVRFLRSTLRVFAAEVDAHARGLGCAVRGHPAVLPVPAPSSWREPEPVAIGGRRR